MRTQFRYTLLVFAVLVDEHKMSIILAPPSINRLLTHGAVGALYHTNSQDQWFRRTKYGGCPFTLMWYLCSGGEEAPIAKSGNEVVFMWVIMVR